MSVRFVNGKEVIPFAFHNAFGKLIQVDLPVNKSLVTTNVYMRLSCRSNPLLRHTEEIQPHAKRAAPWDGERENQFLIGFPIILRKRLEMYTEKITRKYRPFTMRLIKPHVSMKRASPIGRSFHVGNKDGVYTKDPYANETTYTVQSNLSAPQLKGLKERFREALETQTQMAEEREDRSPNLGEIRWTRTCRLALTLKMDEFTANNCLDDFLKLAKNGDYGTVKAEGLYVQDKLSTKLIIPGYNGELDGDQMPGGGFVNIKVSPSSILSSQALFMRCVLWGLVYRRPAPIVLRSFTAFSFLARSLTRDDFQVPVLIDQIVLPFFSEIMACKRPTRWNNTDQAWKTQAMAFDSGKLA